MQVHLPGLERDVPLQQLVAVPFAVGTFVAPWLLYKSFNIPKTRTNPPRWYDPTSQARFEQATETLKMLDESPAKVSGFLNSVKREAVGFNDSDPSVLVSFGLGATATLGIGLTAFTKNWANFGLYLTSLSAFHLLEYQYAKTFQPKECDSDSFLITQSTESQVAVLAAFIEFFVEKLALCHTSLGDYLPEALKNFKTDWRIWAPAAGCVALFQIIRTISMWTAGSNFHHQVRTEREESHELVTSGIYAWSRHPAYFGWFWWAISTQVLLGNPFCTILYTILSWRFFRYRIQDEEENLIKFFGDKYKNYRKSTGVGIPFITWGTQ